MISSREVLFSERALTPEADRRVSIGVVLVVVAASETPNEGPLVWTVVEQQGKDETDKIAGQISLPAETRKVGEQEVGTVLGALGEFTDSDEALRHLYVNPSAFYAREPILVKGKPVDVAFMVYDGPPGESLRPVDPSETIANGWMPAVEIQSLNGEIRNVAHDSVDFAFRHDIFASLGRQSSELVPLSSILEPGFSIKLFIEQREQQLDIPLA